MKRLLPVIAFMVAGIATQAQTLDNKVEKAVARVYTDYKKYFDNDLLAKHVVLDRKKSYLIYNPTQKIKTLAIADDSYIFDEFCLSFAIVYKGDTIRHLPVCRLDTNGTLMALGTPTNPAQHGDALPAYYPLVKGELDFDYKKLQKYLRKMKLEANETDLRAIVVDGKKEPVWFVTLACPEIKCRVLQVSAQSGKLIADTQPQ